MYKQPTRGHEGGFEKSPHGFWTAIVLWANSPVRTCGKAFLAFLPYIAQPQRERGSAHARACAEKRRAVELPLPLGCNASRDACASRAEAFFRLESTSAGFSMRHTRARA